MDYKIAYFYLFNEISKAIETLNHSKFVNQEISQTIISLKQAQCGAEDLYINAEEKENNR